MMTLMVAIRNLLSHSRRTFLLGGAIAGVTMIFCLLTGMFHGMETSLLQSATTLSTGHVNVAGFYKTTPGVAVPLVINADKIVEIVRKNVPELDYVTQRGRGWAKIISDSSAIQSGIGGIDIQNEPGFRKVMHIVQGNLD